MTRKLASRRKIALPALLIAAVLAGVVGTVAVGGGTSAPASAPPQRLSTAVVQLTDLATTTLTEGTLGYAPARPVLNQVAGTYTWLPPAGRAIRPGQALYRVDDQPVILMAGRIPAWRPFGPGMTSGRDIRELQANLIALGYASGLLTTPTGYFDGATDAAVQRWQYAHGMPETGQIALGQVIFAPSAIRVGAPDASPGDPAAPGAAPFLVTTAVRTVAVPVNPNLPTVTVGERVPIILPSNVSTPGVVTAIGPPPATPGSSTGSAGSGGSQSTVSSQLTVAPLRPAQTGTGLDVPVQVALTVQSVRHVLAVPVTALLALAGGGYGVEIVLPSGAHRLIGVTACLFAGGQVQVSGPGITAGTKVVTSQ